MIVLAAALMAGLTFLFVLFLGLFIRRRQHFDIFHRLRRHYDRDLARGDHYDLLQRGYKFITLASEPLASLHFVRRVEFKLHQAGIPLMGAEFIIISLLAASLCAVCVYFGSLNLQFSLATLVLVPIIFWGFVRRRIERLNTAFTEQLGDCLTTVANALRAGYSFQQAIDVVAREMEPPMSTEFARMTADISMGLPLETALEQMNSRVHSSDFELVVTAVLIQREVGGNLAQILDSISYTINERIRMKREIRALTAQGRLSAIVLLLLPFGVALFCYFFNHEQFIALFDEEAGLISVICAFGLELIGFFVIQKIVDIEL